MPRQTLRRTSTATLRRRLFLETLEDRRTPTTFTVFNKDNLGAGSLRQAILDANGAAGADTIVFDTTFFSIVRTILLTSELPITDPVTITGPGAKLAEVDGNNASRVFNINIPGAGAAVTISGLTITRGKSTNGGGLLLQDDALTLTGCAVVGNTATTVELGGVGGGISIENGGSLTVQRSTFSGNSADHGGAINLSNGGGSITFENSTMSGNSASQSGGGIFFKGSAGNGILVRNSTITNNTAPFGGGIYRVSTSTPGISVESSIVSGNSATFSFPDISSGGITMTANFSAFGSNVGLLSGSNNLPIGADLKLGPLTDNGGPTQTHALLSGSPAVDAGSNPGGLTTDQRGLVRTWNGQVDIGAVESDPSFVVRNTNDSGKDSLRQQVLDANAFAGKNAITFDPTVFVSAKTVTLTTGELPITDAVTIAGPGAKLATVSGNNASRVFNINIPGAGAAVTISGLTITGGKAGSGGGFLLHDDALTLTECAVVGNAVNEDGGGIHINGGGILTVQRSTFSGNSASWGGAISTYNGGGSILVENSTISGNSGGTGGGIYFIGVGGSGITVRNSTITANTSGNGGGIFRASGAGITLESSIVSGNVGGANPDIFSNGLPVTANFSAVGSSVGFPSLTGTGNLAFGADLKLGPLADNGGPTLTHALLRGSAAIDAGSNVGGLTNDQRGLGYPRLNSGVVDIGALESNQVFLITNDQDSGSGSLRQAVLDANAFGSVTGEDILFDPVFFATGKTITLTSGELLITGLVTIAGPGAKLATVSGNNASRVFNINLPGAGGAVAISGLTITGGKASTGGGILLQDDVLTLTECTVSGNTATSTDGGGIHIQGGGSFTVRRSTFSGNSAVFGGAISAFNGGGSIVVENSTISGNSASAGGAIYFRGMAGSGVTIRNSTVTANTAGFGGGIARSSGSTPGISLESSIVSGNTGGSAHDIYSGIAVTANFSAVGSNSGFSSLTGTGNLAFAADLKLAPLADNGGPTQTHALLPGSSAIDAGSNIGGLSIDQRGQVRTWNGQADIGAVESDPLFIVRNTNDAGKDSLRQQVLDANAFAGANTVTFDPMVFASAKTITLTGELLITDAVTITGPGAKLTTVSGNNAGRVFNINVPGTGAAVAISGLTITGGKANSGGGILLQDDALTLTECTVSGNTATSTDGGGIHIQGGGGLTVRRSIFSGNSAVYGGAISTYNGGGSILVENSTISGNSAAQFGGGIYFSGASGSGITIRNSTVTANTASQGGGITRNSGPSVTLESSIVSGNNGGGTPDIISNGGIAVTANFSVVGSNAGFSFLDGANNLPFGADLKLGPLADNGGPTQTHALLPGSAAIDVGSNPGALTTDQRGLVRTWNAQADIGAVESDPQFAVRNTNDAGKDSLRQQVLDANAFAGANTVTFDPTVFASAKTITLTTGELSITDAVTITGPGAKLATVSGNNASRVFNINIPGTGAAVAMSGLTITGGKATTGGGILLPDDALTLTECTVSGNTATSDGGGIFVPGGGSLTVKRSTFSGNSSHYGGGIEFYPAGGSLVVENSTISGNSANSNGGGIIFYGGGSGIVIRNSTITANSAGNGGGIFRASGSPPISLESSIVSGNTSGGAPDILSDTPVTANFSAVGSNVGFPSLSGSNNLPFGADLKLGPLADNGGPTKTHALLPGSVAINTGNMVGAPATDQRGLQRVVGTTDIGAFELQPAVKVANVVVGDGTNQRSLVTQIKVTFDSPVVFIGDPAAAFELFRSKDSAAVNLAAAVSGNDVTLTFTGGAVDGKSLSDGLYTLKVLANQIGVEGGFDGDSNGTSGDDYILVGSTFAAPKLFRLFGDADGNGTVNSTDFATFRTFFGLGASMFDFNADGQTNSNDFAEFRKRFGITLVP